MLMLCNNPQKKTSRHIKQVLRIAKLQRGVMMKVKVGGEKAHDDPLPAKRNEVTQDAAHAHPPSAVLSRGGQKRGRRTPVDTARRPSPMGSTARIGMTVANKVEPGEGGIVPRRCSEGGPLGSSRRGGTGVWDVMHAHCDSVLRTVPRGEGPLLCVVCLRPSSRVCVAARSFAGMRKSLAGSCAVAVLCYAMRLPCSGLCGG